MKGLQDGGAIVANQHIPVSDKRLGPFGLLPHGHARGSEQEGLFLQSTRVGCNTACTLHKGEHVQQTERIEQMDAVAAMDAILLNHLACAWMDREEHGQLAALKRLQNTTQSIRVISIDGAMDRRNNVLILLDPQPW